MLGFIQATNRSNASTATRDSSPRSIYAFTKQCIRERRRLCARRAVKRSLGGTRCGVTPAVILGRDRTGATSAVKRSLSSPRCQFTSDCTRGRDPIRAMCAARRSSHALQ
uniref:Uncharacterized protein n=1 Tax=Cacopsylla melanoneura TaxID=428564 RepID=A0A8D9A4D3_9HEMI